MQNKGKLNLFFSHKVVITGLFETLIIKLLIWYEITIGLSNVFIKVLDLSSMSLTISSAGPEGEILKRVQVIKIANLILTKHKFFTLVHLIGYILTNFVLRC